MLQHRLAQSLRLLARQTPPRGARIPGGLEIRPSHIALTRSASGLSAPTSSYSIRKRWYSSGQEAEAKPEEAKKSSEEDKDGGKQEEEKQEEDPVQAELEARKKEIVELTDRVKRSVADYRNLQEQTRREVSAAREFALQRFAKDLLDSVDNLDRALTTVPAEKLTSDNQDLINLHSGLKMTDTILMQTLKKHGLERFDPSENGDMFDPNRHEAVFQAPMKDKQDGACFHTQQKGFVYNGRILRAAKVGVAKNS